MTIKKIYFTISFAFTISVGTDAQILLNRDNVNDVVKSMTLEEKVNLVVGVVRDFITPPEPAPGMPHRAWIDAPSARSEEDSSSPTAFSKGRIKGAAGDVQSFEHMGITSMVLADGPAGLRIDAKRPGDKRTYYCTAFPIASLLSSSWDPAIVEKVGIAMGNEVKEYGADILLAPAINIQRNPLCGRNFEYFSEDPLLAGKIAAAYIRGIQSNGVGTSLKHFAVNNQETFRNGLDVHVNKKALREIYLRAFEIAIKEGRPWTIMSSYNKINGVLAPENRWLLTDILRKEWGFTGFVMTDWWAEQNGARQIAAGNDMLMPGSKHQYEEIINAVRSGEMDIRFLDDAVRNILNILIKSPTFNRYAYNNKPDLKNHAELSRQAASEGMVLLKNDGATLPMKKYKIALYGVNSYDILVGGSGSGYVNRAYKTSLDKGLTQAGYRLDNGIARWYTSYIEKEKAKLPEENAWAVPAVKERTVDNKDALRAAKSNDIAVVTIGRMAGEGGDRKLVKGDWYLTDVELQNLKTICNAFHLAGKKVVVILNMGSIIEMSQWSDMPDAILHSFMGGQEAGNAIADILSGKVNPSGKLPFTIAKNYGDYSSSTNFPSSDNVDGQVDYTEGTLVGYRWFNTKHIPPLYPFGYGMSYTSFQYNSLNIVPAEDGYQIAVCIKNTGKRAGKEVVELYVHAPGKLVMRPEQELKAFSKTSLLRPGQSEIVHLTLKKSDLRYFDDYQEQWQQEPGTYLIKIGSSSEDIRMSKEIII